MKMRIFLFGLMVPWLALAQTPPPEAPSTAAAPAAPLPANFDTLLVRPDLWTKTPADLGELLRAMRFQWTSAAKDTVRSAAPGLVLAKRPLSEVLLEFQNGTLASATLFYYSRGTGAELREYEFQPRLAEITKELTELTGVQPEELGRDASSAVKAEGRRWVTATSEFLLEWSSTKKSATQMIAFRAEFIRLTVTPKSTATHSIGETMSTLSAARQAVKSFSGPEHVERAENGDVKLKDIPMVDQGQRGYCVVASVERVMRYYGATVDQSELAQIADSDASRGTSVTSMVASLNRLTSRLGVKARTSYAWDTQEFFKVMTDYNRATKAGKVAPLVPINGMMIDIDACLQAVKPDLYKDVRLKKVADYGKFQREIERNIDAGIPLLWSVHLGLFPEAGLSPNAMGGHMRLIIGYNEKTHEVIYSDSWGLGHEEKRMPMDEAWTITMGLNTVQPIGS